VEQLVIPWSTKPNIKQVALTVYQSSIAAIFILDK
jgi:hypothetical protein